MSSYADSDAATTMSSKCQKSTNASPAFGSIGTESIVATTDTISINVAPMDSHSPDEDVKMDIDTDLTTTATLDDLKDEQTPLAPPPLLGNRPLDNPRKVDTVVAKDEPLTADQINFETKANSAPVTEASAPNDGSSCTPDGDADALAGAEAEADAKDTSSLPGSSQPPHRLGKITRNNVNGVPTPTIIKRLRKSTRSTRFKSKLAGRGNGQAGGSTNVQNGQGGSFDNAAGSNTHGVGGVSGKSHGKQGMGAAGGARNRRSVFKRPAQKTPKVQASTQFVKSVFYKGSYIQIGDIVSLVDSEQRVYYAQIRGLLVDEYCEKSAFLTWLIPTQDSPDPLEGFDPATYLIGPDEEISRKLSYLEFIMHAPSNYYFDRTTPFPMPDDQDYTTHRTGGFIWTRLPTVKRDRERERKAAA